VGLKRRPLACRERACLGGGRAALAAETPAREYVRSAGALLPCQWAACPCQCCSRVDSPRLLVGLTCSVRVQVCVGTVQHRGPLGGRRALAEAMNHCNRPLAAGGAEVEAADSQGLCLIGWRARCSGRREYVRSAGALLPWAARVSRCSSRVDRPRVLVGLALSFRVHVCVGTVPHRGPLGGRRALAEARNHCNRPPAAGGAEVAAADSQGSCLLGWRECCTGRRVCVQSAGALPPWAARPSRH
jgi:hypothetical protein